jgi:hypothetical protein
MPYYSQDMIGGAMNSTHIYYNINISNDYSGWGDISSNGQPMPVDANNKNYQVVFNQTRQQPYIIKPDDYYLSVLRFTIATPNLPVLLCQPIVGQSDVNKSIYAITLVRLNNDMSETVETQNLIWEPDDKSLPIPTGTVTNNWQIDPYYQCHTYTHFMDLINNTFKAFVSSGFLNVVDDFCPYMYFDSEKNLFIVGANAGYYRTSLDGTQYLGNSNYGVKIFFNIELYNLFASLKATYIGASAASPEIGADYQLIMDTGSNVPYANTQPYIENIYVNPEYYRLSPPVPKNDVINTQEYSTIPIWNPVVNIVFRTSLLTVVPDVVGTPVIYEDGFNNINQGKQNSDVLNVMIDYTVPPTTELKPYIIYEPIGEYRLVELYGNQPINSMDIAVFWKDRFGNLQPFYLAIGASATIKILFRKKIFN